MRKLNLIATEQDDKPGFTERLRMRRADKLAREADGYESDEPRGELRICALTGDPAAATDIVRDVEEQQRRLRSIRKRVKG